MAESANTLFHFTDISALEGILQNGFFPKYHKENLSVATPRVSKFKNSYVPMVCFCDLPLSRIRQHIEFYGEYGIGMRKEGWGIEWGISPIIYLPEASKSSIHFQNIAVEIGKKLKEPVDRKAIRIQLRNFYKYIKPYKGEAWHKRKKKNVPVTFYHEREWRYVPEKFEVIGEGNVNSKLIQFENKKMEEKEHRLRFGIHDIKYIVVRTESEIKKFADFIHTNLNAVFPNSDERNLLVSKLISAQQIKEDM